MFSRLEKVSKLLQELGEKLYTLSLQLFFSIGLVAWLAANSLAQDTARSPLVTIAILEFGSAEGSRNVSHSTKEDITNRLNEQLVRSNLYTVVERRKIDKIIKEQSLGLTGLISEKTAVKAGNLLGANFLLYGEIGSVIVIRHEKLVKLKIQGRSFNPYYYTASVTVSARVIDTESGRITSATAHRFSGKGESEERAVYNALSGASGPIFRNLFKARLLVVKKMGSHVIVNRGKNYALREGMTFRTYRIEEEVFDPYTKKSIGTLRKESGIIMIEEVFENWAKAKVVKGRLFGVKPGDELEMIETPVNMRLSFSAALSTFSTMRNPKDRVVVLSKNENDVLFVADYTDIGSPEFFQTIYATIIWTDIDYTGFGFDIGFFLIPKLENINGWGFEMNGRKQFGIIPDIFFLHGSIGIEYISISQDFKHASLFVADEIGKEATGTDVKASRWPLKAAVGARLVFFGNIDFFGEVGYRQADGIDEWTIEYDTGRKNEQGNEITENIFVPPSYLAFESIDLTQSYLRAGLMVHF